MSNINQPAVLDLQFNGAALPTELGSTDTGNGAVAQAANKVTLTLDSTSEAQAAVLYQGDILPFDIDDLQKVTIIAEINATPGTAVSVGFGVCSAQNDTLDSITEGAYFRLDAASLAVKLETDDGTTNVDDLATGFSMVANTPQKFVLNFRDGIQHKVGANSLGGKAAVQAAVENANGNLRPVDLNGTILDMNAYSGGLQLFAQIAKSTGTATGILTIHRMTVEYLARS